MAFGTVCKNTETQENEAWIIAGPTDGSTNIVHHDNNNNYQLLTGVDDQYGAGYTGITCCCKPLFNPATGLLTVDCVCSTATCVDIDTLDNSGVNHPVLFQMYDAVNSELINKLGKSTSVMFNPNCYVCNDPDTGAQICKPVLYVSTICSDEYLGIAEPISYVNSLPVKPENKIYGIQESDTITSMTIKTLARTYFDFDSTNNVYVPKQNLIETDLTIGLSTDVDVQTINSSFTEINGSITVTPETTASGTLTLQRFYAGESTSCNYFKLGSGDGGSGTVEINRQSYIGYKLVASDANGENLRISGPTVTADDNNFSLTISCTNETLTECKSGERGFVQVGCDLTHYSYVEQMRGRIYDRVENDGTFSCTSKFASVIDTCVKSGDNINSVNEKTCYNCKDTVVYGAYGCSQFKSTSDRTEIKTYNPNFTSSISTNVSSGSEPDTTWINQESYINAAGTTKCIQTQLLPKCDKPLWSSYFVTDSSGTTLNHSNVAFCCDGKVYVHCDDTKGWKCLLNEDDIPDATTICPSDTNCEFPLTFYDYDNATFLTGCYNDEATLTYNPATNIIGSGCSACPLIIKRHNTLSEGYLTQSGIWTRIGTRYDCRGIDVCPDCESSATMFMQADTGFGNLSCVQFNLKTTCAFNSRPFYATLNCVTLATQDNDSSLSLSRGSCDGNASLITESNCGQSTLINSVSRYHSVGGACSCNYICACSCINAIVENDFVTQRGTFISCVKQCGTDGKMYVCCDSTKGWKCLLNEDDASSGGTYISWTNPTTSNVNSLTTENSIVGQSYGSINLAIPGCAEFYADATCMTVDKKNIGSLQIRDNGACLNTLGGTLHLDQSGNVTLAVKAGCPGGNIYACTVHATYLDGRISMANGYCAVDCSFMPYSGTGGVYGMGAGDWAHFLTFSHGNFDTYYGTAVRVPFWDNDRWTWRTQNNGALGGIHELLDNRGGQVVCGDVRYVLNDVAAGTNTAYVKGNNPTTNQGYNGGAYLGHYNANYDGYWGFATVGFYNAESGALTPNICMGREGHTWFNNTTFAPNAHVDTCLYGPYGKIDFATNNRIEIEPAAGSDGIVVWGPAQCGYFYIAGNGQPYIHSATGTFIVQESARVDNNLLVCGTPYKLKNNAWCPLTSADEVVPVTTANGTTFHDYSSNTFFERCYGGHVASQVVMGNDRTYLYGSDGTNVSTVSAVGSYVCMNSSSPSSGRNLVVTPSEVYITATTTGLSPLRFANGGCDTTYQGMSMGNPNAFILANMAPQNIVIPVASTGSTDLGNGQTLTDYVGTIVVSADTCRALFNFAGIIGGNPVIGTYEYKATNADGIWVWIPEKGFTQ